MEEDKVKDKKEEIFYNNPKQAKIDSLSNVGCVGWLLIEAIVGFIILVSLFKGCSFSFV